MPEPIRIAVDRVESFLDHYEGEHDNMISEMVYTEGESHALFASDVRLLLEAQKQRQEEVSKSIIRAAGSSPPWGRGRNAW